MSQTQAVQISPQAISYSYQYGTASNKFDAASTSFADALFSASQTTSGTASTAAPLTYTSSSSSDMNGMLTSMLTSMMPSMYPSMDQTSSSGGDSQMMVMMLMMMLMQQQQQQTPQTSAPVTVDDVLNSLNSDFSQQPVEQVPVSSGNSIPSSPSVAVNPPIVNTSGNRSAVAYRSVIDQFKVETNVRYSPKNGKTYCNIFMWDVTRAMNAEIPHYINAKTGEPMYYPNVTGATELNANATQNWLLKYGQKYGWKEVSAQEAQAYANKGMPAITSWKNPNGPTGHVQIVCPSKNGQYDAQKGVTVAQAGKKCVNYTYASNIFGKTAMSQLKYFVHA